ncbi:unnamed protein product [Parnassius apollo]|uniref:(apollo) hypothetical protein n=1 Tax=Parnassius apollo TaxID=110799 RepID=A0A8S3Y2B9_PARAO|nr:unnamed protein product [Parnassius apollo]
MADFRRQKFENEAADINEIDDGLMAGISSGLSRDKDLSDSGSSSVKRSELESSDSDSQSKLSDEDMTPAPSLRRKGRDCGMQQRGAMQRLRGITSRRVTNNRNVPASFSSGVMYIVSGQ